MTRDNPTDALIALLRCVPVHAIDPAGSRGPRRPRRHRLRPGNGSMAQGSCPGPRPGRGQPPARCVQPRRYCNGADAPAGSRMTVPRGGPAVLGRPKPFLPHGVALVRRARELGFERYRPLDPDRLPRVSVRFSFVIVR